MNKKKVDLFHQHRIIVKIAIALLQNYLGVIIKDANRVMVRLVINIQQKNDDIKNKYYKN